jgi:SAM-dependent methyltransferase
MVTERLDSTATPASSRVSYQDAEALWKGYDDFVRELALSEGAKHVAELGGGANPIVGDEEKWGFAPHRIVVDISADELAKAPDDVEKRVLDLCKPIPDGREAYDIVFSKMLCEHVPDGRAFHQNCFDLLRPGGLAVHQFPTLYALPFVLNRLIPEKPARALLRKIQPGRIDNPQYEKFPAYYRWTRGPTKRAIRRFQSVGFELEQFNGSFGHHYYHLIKPLDAIEQAKSRFLLKHPVAALTSFAVVVLRKPA